MYLTPPEGGSDDSLQEPSGSQYTQSDFPKTTHTRNLDCRAVSCAAWMQSSRASAVKWSSTNGKAQAMTNAFGSELSPVSCGSTNRIENCP